MVILLFKIVPDNLYLYGKIDRILLVS